MIGIRKLSFDLEFTHLEGVEFFRAHPSHYEETKSVVQLAPGRELISFAEIDKSLIRSSFRGRNSDCTSAESLKLGNRSRKDA